MNPMNPMNPLVVLDKRNYDMSAVAIRVFREAPTGTAGDGNCRHRVASQRVMEFTVHTAQCPPRNHLTRIRRADGSDGSREFYAREACSWFLAVGSCLPGFKVHAQ